MSSKSVDAPDLFQSFEKKNTVTNPPTDIYHQIQFPAIPCPRMISVTARGVSAAKVVATMAVPATNQDKLPSAWKYSFVDFCLERKRSKMRTMTTKGKRKNTKSKK